MIAWRVIRPLDVLFLRGNQLFGEPGDHAEATMPPWPSVFAGAIRSRMLVDAGVDLGRFTDEHADPPGRLAEVLGTPTEPGSFRLAGMALLRPPAGEEPPEPVYPLPADVVVLPGEDPEGPPRVHRLVPGQLPEGLECSSPLPLVPILRSGSPAKPRGGYYLSARGLGAWARGGIPAAGDLVPRDDLWRTDARLGIARDRGSGTAVEGGLYTSVAVSPRPGGGFLVGVEGVPEDLLPSSGLLRLGGDGRGAEIAPWDGRAPELPQIGEGEPFGLYLETPGLFPRGWLPPGVDPETLVLEAEGLQARLAAAVVPRHGVVSGWDVAAHRPKPAQRAVPAGSVYLFDSVRGNPGTYPGLLWRLAEEELGGDWSPAWRQRRAEGFGNVHVVRWPGEESLET